MILGCGTAQTDEEIITEYRHLLVETGLRLRSQKELWNVPIVMSAHIGTSLRAWNPENILSLFQTKSRAITSRYAVFLVFLFFRGYMQPTLELIWALKINCVYHWRPLLAPFQERLRQTYQECHYTSDIGRVLSLLIQLCVTVSKPVEEISRDDYETFRHEFTRLYELAQRSQRGIEATQLSRLELVLIHWKILMPVERVLRYEEWLTELRHETIRAPIVRYFEWCAVHYRISTLRMARDAVLAFFLWFQERYPDRSRLDEVTRPIALEYAQYLKALFEAGRFGASHRNRRYYDLRRFFAFAVEEGLPSAPLHNPFSTKDMPKKPDMVPRYLSDKEIQAVLAYCAKDASLVEKTLVITLLHTGIRAGELAVLKSSDLVQIAGIWKLHIHEGKGLKDRLVPLTPQCLAAIKQWQKEGWERTNASLFTFRGRPWADGQLVSNILRRLGQKVGVMGLTPHRFRHTFAVALLNYGIRESALQKLMGHATLTMTLEYARILDQTVEHSFTQAIEHMQEEKAHSWVPSFFAQDEYTMFAEGDAVSWIRLPLGYCRRNPKLHCESDVKCLLCDRFAIGAIDLPRLRQMHERFLNLGLTLKADVVAAQIQRLEAHPSDPSGVAGFIPTSTISVRR